MRLWIQRLSTSKRLGSDAQAAHRKQTSWQRSGVKDYSTMSKTEIWRPCYSKRSNITTYNYKEMHYISGYNILDKRPEQTCTVHPATYYRGGYQTMILFPWEIPKYILGSQKWISQRFRQGSISAGRGTIRLWALVKASLRFWPNTLCVKYFLHIPSNLCTFAVVILMLRSFSVL